jgi:hypothetical protein
LSMDIDFKAMRFLPMRFAESDACNAFCYKRKAPKWGLG